MKVVFLYRKFNASEFLLDNFNKKKSICLSFWTLIDLSGSSSDYQSFKIQVIFKIFSHSDESPSGFSTPRLRGVPSLWLLGFFFSGDVVVE